MLRFHPIAAAILAVEQEFICARLTSQDAGQCMGNIIRIRLRPHKQLMKLTVFHVFQTVSVHLRHGRVDPGHDEILVKDRHAV